MIMKKYTWIGFIYLSQIKLPSDFWQCKNHLNFFPLFSLSFSFLELWTPLFQEQNKTKKKTHTHTATNDSIRIWSNMRVIKWQHWTFSVNYAIKHQVKKVYRDVYPSNLISLLGNRNNAAGQALTGHYQTADPF